MADLDQYLLDITHMVCTDLARTYEWEQPSEHGLIFPRKRDGSVRISEQETKLLFVQRLTVDKRFLFSVETPTLETYQQKGKNPMSGRVDLTLFGPDRKAIAHIELKAHNCTVEAIRKDLEKLLREKTTGLWFHTLHRANRQTLATLNRKFRSAFSLLPEYLGTSDRSYLIAFFVLDEAVLKWQWLRFVGDDNRNCKAVSTMFGEKLECVPWIEERFRAEGTGKQLNARSKHQQRTGSRKGQREAFFVFIPQLVSDTALHLSIRRGSYRLRRYDLTESTKRPRAFTLPTYTSFEALRTSNLIARWIPVTAEDLDHSLDKETQYWRERIRAVNRQHFTSEDEAQSST